MREQDINAPIDYRLEEALEPLADAELLLKAGRYRSTANRLYYAAFYAAVAALLTKRLEYSRHSAGIAFFDKEMIRTGVLPREYSRTLHRAFSERQQDDYIPFVELDGQEIESLFADVTILVKGIRDYVMERS